MYNHRQSKKKQLALRFFTYGVMTFAIVVFSIISLLLLMGYRFDSRSGTIEQGGLLQFRSFPSDASVFLDGKRLSFRTPGRINVSSGQHDVLMRLSGYQDWRKTTNVEAGELKWLNYARLVPSDITTVSVDRFDTVAGTLPSPDRRWFALLKDSASPVITLYDLRRPDEPVAISLTIPAEAFTMTPGQPHRFELVEWDIGSKYMIVRHTVGDVTEHIRVDRAAVERSVNLDQLFGIQLSSVHFSGTSGNLLYALSDRTIRRLDVGDRAISSPLVTGVESYELHDEHTIGYVALRDASRIVGVYEDDTETVVRSFDAAVSVLVDISSYFDHNYLAVYSGGKLEIIKDPEDGSEAAGRAFATIELDVDPAWLRFVSSGRFVTAGRGGEFETYDLETDERFTGSLGGAATDAGRPLRWLDDYYLVSDAGGSLSIGEFDGSNQHAIVQVAEGFRSTLSSDGEYLFSIGRTNGSYTLQSSRMVVTD